MSFCKVNVQQGTLQGKYSTSYNGRQYYSFEGIPYARPPVGKLRFRDPQPPDRWTGIRNATKPGNKCAQLDPFKPTKMDGSEDCLYLNIYTPSLPTEKLDKLPVIFYVHGGRYLLGYGDYYRPDYFLENDVVFVTINYRLHILGFLALNTAEVPGNAGLKDAVLALRWVKHNIGSFNGDASNITVMGESSGAGTVTSFLASKMTDGLFSKLIAESGSCLSDLLMIDEDLLARAKFVASHLGKDLSDVKDLLAFLENAPIEDLLQGVVAAEYSKETINAFFLPVVEKKFEGVESFFEESPFVTFRENRIKKVPVLAGYASHEGAFFIPRGPDGSITFQTDLQFFIPKYLFVKKDSDKAKKIAANLGRFYFGNKDIDERTKENYLNFVSDAYFLRDMHTMIELISKYNNEVYIYRFEYVGNMNTRVMKNIGVKGACHGDTLQYQFYRKSKAENCTQKDKEIVRFFSDAWYNFVKTGKPSWRNQKVQWLPYTRDRTTLNIGDELSIVNNPGADRMALWKIVTSDRAKL